ncbi:MAG: hypothetical protein QOG62_277 [Thermoleophilaceae bacterium]|nr:hypothetical protein [Thermoleophilaceae bacterium]
MSATVPGETWVTPEPPPRTQDRMWSDIGLPAETIELRARARDVVARRVAPHAREIAQREESRDSFPWEAFKGIAEEGMLRLPFSGEHGANLEHPILGTCTFVEELAYESSSMAGVYDGQCLLVARSLDFARGEVRDRYLPGLTSGELVACFATTEPEASSDLSPTALQTMAEPVDGGFVVNGRKRWITNSVVGDFVVALCRTGDALTMLLIDLKDNPGVTVGDPDLKMGHRGQITADIVFEDTFVPEENVLGEPERGLGVALAALAYGRVGIAAAGVGVAQAAMDLAVERLRSRELFGKKLGEMQHWQFRLAEKAIELESARNLYQKTCMRMEAGEQAEPEASMAKILATRLANDLARDALQVHGGYGFARRLTATGDAPRLEEIYRDAKILEIFEGANEVLTWVVARHLIGRDITG